MANSQSHEDQSSADEGNVMASRLSAEDSNVLKAKDGLTLDVPSEFFNEYDVKGCVFKLKPFDLTEEKIAVKWVRKKHNCGFGNHIEALQRAADMASGIITSFMQHVDTQGWDIKVVKPLQSTEENLEIGVEPFIEDVEQFNSNSFWECNALRNSQKLVVALSHFSYASSNGEHVLTNLQGGIIEESKTVVLLTPTLVSEKTGKFGCLDVGNAAAFFNEHTCNCFCHNMPMPERESNDGYRFHFTENGES